MDDEHGKGDSLDIVLGLIVSGASLLFVGGWVIKAIAARQFRLAVGCLALLIVTSGCASLGSLGISGLGDGGRRKAPPLRIERSEAPAHYDVLVAEFAKIDGDFEAARAAFERAAEKDPDSAVIHASLATLAWQLEDVPGAVREAERAFELDPDSVPIRLFLGRLYRLQRDIDGLNRVLRDEDGRPLDADSTYVLYQVAFERGDLEEAERLARDLSNSEPDQLRGTLALATVYERRAEFDAAETIVREALETFPDHFLLFMRLAEIERARGNRDGEIAVYREVLASHPGHYGILQRLGQAQVDANDLEGAIQTFEEIVERYPDDLNSLRRLASLEFSAGRYESAAARLEIVLNQDGDRPELAFALGQIRKATGDIDGAIRTFDKIERQDPNYFDARIQIAAILESEERFDEAIVEIDRLRAFRPDRQLDLHAAELMIAAGDFEGGIALMKSLLDGSDGDAEIFYRLGVQYGTHRQIQLALRYMQKVLELDQNNVNALNFIGYSWAELGQNLDEAEELIHRALEIAPEDGYVTDSLGWVYYRMAEMLFKESRRDEALQLLDRAHKRLVKAAELTGGDSVVSEHLGDVLLLRGDKEGALDHYEEAVGLDMREDDQPMLLEKRDRLRGDLGRVPQAGETP